MCGIVGIFSTCDAPPPHRELWPDLVNHLWHRGPDGGALYADHRVFLGHRRLAIIDLDGGLQPMATQDGSLVISFNGEIYNYVELRAELEGLGHRFRTRSDTEVLLHGYQQWGDELPTHLVGMFAFALADRRRRRLYLARDRFGEKPLFLLRQPRYVAFASELRPLCALPDLDREIDVAALGGYLSLNYVPGTATMLRHVRRLAPGRWTSFDEHGEEHGGRFWRPPLPTAAATADPLDEPAALDQLQRRFDEAVSVCLRSDVPVGVLLSGGIDSSLIAESAARQGRLDQAYMIDFAEASHSERPAAEAVARRLGVPLRTVTLDASALERFVELVEHADDPLADSSALAVWTVSRLAATGNKVVLGGDGGDELFAGYLTYTASLVHGGLIARLPGPLRRLGAALAHRIPTSEGKVTGSYKLWRFLRALDLPSAQAHLTFNGTWLPAEAAQLVSAEARPVVAGALAEAVARLGLEDAGLLALQRADVSEYLPNDILTKVDRMSMAHGLEVRAPFLDHRLASWALALPPRLKIGRGLQLKRLLREAARRRLGAEIADRPKQGFSIPIHGWLRGPFASQLRELLSPATVARFALLDGAAIQRVLEAHLSGRRSYGFELWGLAVLLAWHQRRVERPPGRPAHREPLQRVTTGAPGSAGPGSEGPGSDSPVSAGPG